ncbi:putative ATP-dependent RNA helicase DDX56 [Brevipalpus obovatus]|uniref:putative ATP-dependent RNA helicase DDX56 n=1 Tax=Brevipalpus obovatus TaxID=246614 RepID=UPI003D9EB65A
MGDDKVVQFEEMGLDNRLLKSIKLLGWKEPTMIQEKAIPLALEGKDLLAKGRTGCGKTGAFLIPIMHQILSNKKYDSNQSISAIILAPTKELCRQIFIHAKDLNHCSSNAIRIVDLNEGESEKSLKPILIEKPDIVISTPSRLLKHLKIGNLDGVKEGLKFLVADEADLMFSFGYEADMKEVLSLILPSYGCQCFLTSATLNAEALELKKLVLNNPVTLKLEEPDLLESGKLTQYHVKCEDDEKFVILSAMFKLNLLRGKTIIFVNNVNQCYKIKLFLEQFGVRSCVLNSELPIKSRCFAVEQFNRGTYDIIVANDEICLENIETTKKTSKKKKKRDIYEECSNVSRGIDFQYVSNVINFDFPLTFNSYVHRVGRTARGCQDTEGTALSLISIKELPRFELMKDRLETGSSFKPYVFRMEELEPFRYRCRDALRAITGIAIKEARIKEIKREILSSEKLKSYLKEHPKDFKVLTQDKALGTTKQKFDHLKHVPEYIIPPTLQGAIPSTSVRKRHVDGGSIKYETQSHQVKRRKRNRKKGKDPLEFV